MTYHNMVQNMDIETMAILFASLAQNTEHRFLTKLVDTNISYDDFYNLSFEHQVELYKIILESEYETT